MINSNILIKDSDAGKDWKQTEKGAAVDKMVREHHWLNGQEFEQTLGDSEGQRSVACWSPWSLKELDTTLDWTTTKSIFYIAVLPNRNTK